MDYAVIKTGGKQYKVSQGSVLEIEKLPGNANDKISFAEVLLVSRDGNVKVGTPKVAGAAVDATILEQKRGDKIRVSKFKAKSRYRRTTGHRQFLTKVKIEAVAGSARTESKEARPIAKAKTPVRARKTVAKA